MKKTIQDVQFIHNPFTGDFRLYDGTEEPNKNRMESLVTIPKGTATTHQTACGVDENYNFVVDKTCVHAYYQHDLTYHGANIPSKFVK